MQTAIANENRSVLVNNESELRNNFELGTSLRLLLFFLLISKLEINNRIKYEAINKKNEKSIIFLETNIINYY